MRRLKQLLLILVCGLMVQNSLLSAADAKKPIAPKPNPGKTAEAPPPPAAAAHPNDGNVQTLITTLNETLEENRKIRDSLKGLQQSVEEKTIENNRLVMQIQKLEAVSIQGNQELSQKVLQLQGQLDQSGEAIKLSEDQKTAFDKEKQEIGDQIGQLKAENEKINELLKSSILKEEKEELLQMIKHNESAAASAVGRVADVNGMNEKLREELDQAYYKLGNTLFEMHDYEGAAIQYNKAIEWNPANAWAHHNLGVVYDFYLNQNNLALIHYQKYLDYEPADEKSNEIRLRILDLNQIKKVIPESPLKADFEELHKTKF